MSSRDTVLHQDHQINTAGGCATRLGRRRRDMHLHHLDAPPIDLHYSYHGEQFRSLRSLFSASQKASTSALEKKNGTTISFSSSWKHQSTHSPSRFQAITTAPSLDGNPPKQWPLSNQSHPTRESNLLCSLKPLSTMEPSTAVGMWESIRPPTRSLRDQWPTGR